MPTERYRSGSVSAPYLERSTEESSCHGTLCLPINNRQFNIICSLTIFCYNYFTCLKSFPLLYHSFGCRYIPGYMSHQLYKIGGYTALSFSVFLLRGTEVLSLHQRRDILWT
nr:hypothetical protein [Escherichia coli]